MNPQTINAISMKIVAILIATMAATIILLFLEINNWPPFYRTGLALAGATFCAVRLSYSIRKKKRGLKFKRRRSGRYTDLNY